MTSSALYNTLLVLALIVALLFSLLVFFTSKGDAMQSGGAIRTTFRGRETFDETIAKYTFGLGIGFMVLMVLLDILAPKS